MSAKRREKSLIQLENQLKTLQATLLLADSYAGSVSTDDHPRREQSFALFATDDDTITELQEEYNKIIFKKHKVWSRSFVIPKTFVGISFQVHNGTKFQDILITEEIVGYRFGEFVPTRKVTVHKQVKG